ncbi:MAG: porin [Saprospiraceae bacterium]|nr:porin [Saprospiraceae bacterium]
MAFATQTQAQQPTEPAAPAKPAEPEKKWYETISLKGYSQVRYNRLLETNKDLKCEACDRSIGDNGGFFIRRSRLVFSGHLNKRVYFYVQPDIAQSVDANNLHFFQIRDAYFDLGLDDENQFRFRIGQSKVPFGFDNLQSSQNRLNLDRSDAINSAAPNERDLGVVFFWTPTEKRKLLERLPKEGLKGTGNYGVFAIGAYNGQSANKPELNNEPHIVSRVTWPMEIGSQIVEASVQAYTGKAVVGPDKITKDVKINTSHNYTDQRFGGTFVLFPKPFGIQAEYNVGKGPQFNPVTDSIEVQDLKGGYVVLSYLMKKGNHTIIPFARIQHYEGGKKNEQDARSYDIDEVEFGIEWAPVKYFELTAAYNIAKRRYEDFAKQDNYQEGQFLRLQAQLNF